VFNPFSNDDDVLNIQGDALTVSNGTTRVTLSGTLALTKDRRGLKAAQADLPERIKDEADVKPGAIDNPFN
jgi:hypothetical protein